MTDTTTPAVTALMDGVTPRYLITKYSGYYRPNERGYTGSAIQAGRYTLNDAEKITHPNGPDGPRDGMTFIHEDDLQDDDWKAYAALRAERDAAIARAEAAEARVAELEAAQGRAWEAGRDAAAAAAFNAIAKYPLRTMLTNTDNATMMELTILALTPPADLAKGGGA